MQGILVCFGEFLLVGHSAKVQEVLGRLHGHDLRYLLPAFIVVFCVFDRSVLFLLELSGLRPNLESVGLWRESYIHPWDP